jgi:SAM-dependent methyltransferase
VLDIGSYLGYFCLAARERNAGRVVGWEIDLERRRRARILAGIKGLQVEYHGGDIERDPVDERFDIVLCLNLLHHLRDPIAVLDRLVQITRETLVLEVATIGWHDRKKFGLSALTSYFLGRSPVMLVGKGDTSGKGGQQKFFMTRSAVRNLLAHQRNAFARIEFIDSEFKGRFLVVARKRIVDELIVVAGPTSAGKSSLIDELRAGKHPELAQQLGVGSLAGVPLLSAAGLGRDQTLHHPRLIFHYDFMRPFGRSAKTHDRDEGLDVLQSAKRIHFVTLWTPPDRLRAQLVRGELSGAKPHSRHTRIARLYERDERIHERYDEWFDFIERVASRVEGQVLTTVVVESDRARPGLRIVEQKGFRTER